METFLRMKKIGVLFIILIILSFSVSAISKYYSSIVTGQDISGELSTGSVYENLILGTPDPTTNRINFQTCTFSGDGDNKYRYMNTLDDIIYLSDSTFINVFDNQCFFSTSQNVNGTLASNPFLLDTDNNDVANIIYITNNTQLGLGIDRSFLNIAEFNGVGFDPLTRKRHNISTDLCFGLYCDRNSKKCGTVCGASGNCYGLVLTIDNDNEISNNQKVEFGGDIPTCRTWFNKATEQYIALSTTGIVENVFSDISMPLLTGMDLDRDGNIEVATIATATFDFFELISFDLETAQIHSNRDNFFDLPTTATFDQRDIITSAGGFQVANIGGLNTHGDMLLSILARDQTTGAWKRQATIYSSQGVLQKTISFHSDPNAGMNTSFKLSNFAVADINKDLRNDYCIALNYTEINNKTNLKCFSGLTGTQIVNCEIKEWSSNNPITLALLEWDTASTNFNGITPMGIYDMSKNDGSQCDRLYEFENINNASTGVLVPVDVTSDNKPDIIYYGSDGAYLFTTGSLVGSGTKTGIVCGADHIIFCDDFNYNFPYFDREWITFNGADSNLSMSPINNKMQYIGGRGFLAEHFLPRVNVEYNIEYGRTIRVSNDHPVVSHEFTLNISNRRETIFFYQVFDPQLLRSISLRFENDSVFFYNRSKQDFTRIGEVGGMKNNVTHKVKITQYFGLDTVKSYPSVPEFYPFNISRNNSVYDVWIDDVLIATNLLFQDVKSFKAQGIFTGRNPIAIDKNETFILDDLFIYRGTSKDVDNSILFFTDLFIESDMECRTFNQTCAIPNNCCSGLTCFTEVNAIDSFCIGLEDDAVTDPRDNAIINAFREIPTGGLGFGVIWLIVMFVVGIAVFMTTAEHVNGTVAIGGTIIIEVFLLILGTILGFVPPAIIISIVVLGLIVIGLFLRRSFTGSEN